MKKIFIKIRQFLFGYRIDEAYMKTWEKFEKRFMEDMELAKKIMNEDDK